MFTKSSLFILVVMMTISSALGLKCYICNSQKNKDCSVDDFDRNAAEARGYLHECTAMHLPIGLDYGQMNDVSFACRKTYQKVMDHVTVQRSCSWVVANHTESRCHQSLDDDARMLICSCLTDLCNESTSSAGSLWLLLVGVGSAAAGRLLPH
ncbi:unnamed protein product [Notodromas monacha]|uniref:Protein sleepless n=1 Tax=Notodromas monacha TaxID=399045 RepID=A0A7R9GBH0_9CRUS|nr:unnamed protein product [Notodromas monacha]CAG0916501.1 unnamed protein product [Notodromas monacha]